MVLLHRWLLSNPVRHLIVRSCLTLCLSAPAAALPTPQILNVAGQCPETVISWTSSGDGVVYLVMLTGSGGVYTQVATTTQTSFFELAQGTYKATVRVISGEGSDNSPSFPFEIGPCGHCGLPSVTLNPPDPSRLWPPNGRVVSVLISGRVGGIAADCPLTRARYHVTDSQGWGSDGIPAVQNDGATSFMLPLVARREGADQESRRYEIIVKVENLIGAATSNAVQVVVPHDQGK